MHVSYADNDRVICCAENGVELPSASDDDDDDDKPDAEVQAPACVAGPVTHPCGMTCLFVCM